MIPRPEFVPDDFELQPRECPVPGYDIAIGDDVWWKGHESEGLFYVGCLARYTADMRPAASVWDQSRNNHTAPLEDLTCIVDAEWWGPANDKSPDAGEKGNA